MKEYISLECQNNMCQECTLNGCEHECHKAEDWGNNQSGVYSE